MLSVKVVLTVYSKWRIAAVCRLTEGRITALLRLTVGLIIRPIRLLRLKVSAKRRLRLTLRRQTVGLGGCGGFNRRLCLTVHIGRRSGRFGLSFRVNRLLRSLLEIVLRLARSVIV